MKESPSTSKLLEQTESNPETFIEGLQPKRRVYKIVLTGGPCGGKTTGQAELATFFESIGWKVFRVPETATVLMSGGIAFGELNDEQVMDFQENLVRTMIAIEDTYFSMAEKSKQNCLVICDRGVMDASAFISRPQWEQLLEKIGLNEEHICEGRYNQIVHMVSAANGAEDFYTVEDHAARFEGLELARDRDRRAMEAWSEHPYRDIVDNRVDFEQKLNYLIGMVVRRIGIKVGDRFKANCRKVKFCIKGPLPPDELFPKFTDFDVIHHYLRTNHKGIQSRLRCRGRGGRNTYTCTVRRPERMGQVVEVKTPLSKKDYENMLNHADSRHLPVYKTRRCFLYNNQQYQLDIYREPCHPRCRGLMLLETFTTLPSSAIMARIPPFLTVSKEVTGDPAFSMYNLALRSDWIANTEHFCHFLVSDEDEDNTVEDEEVTTTTATTTGTTATSSTTTVTTTPTNPIEETTLTVKTSISPVTLETQATGATVTSSSTSTTGSASPPNVGESKRGVGKVFKEIDVLEASRRLAIISDSSTEDNISSSNSSSCDSCY